jgi:hypothetical protein
MTFMPPLNQIEITFPGSEELSSRDGYCQESSDGSVSSEISLDLLAKEQNEERSNESSSTGWDPNGSDYSLDVLLHSKEDAPSLSDSAKGILMNSDYSLNVRLSSHASSCPKDIAPECPIRRVPPKEAEKRSPRQEMLRDARVTFYPRVRIQRVTRRKDLPKKQIQQVWYNREEFKAIRNECYSTIELIADGEELINEDEGLCVRGLEHKTGTSYKTRQRNKLEIRNVVFEEQEFQCDNGMDDPEWIAKLSMDQSRPCVEAGIETARKDERDSRDCLIFDNLLPA